MYKDKSDSNWDKLRKCHNEAKRQRQRAIKSCWRDKSNHLKENPADFYRTSMPFLSSKASKKSSQLNLKIGEEIVSNPGQNYLRKFSLSCPLSYATKIFPKQRLCGKKTPSPNSMLLPTNTQGSGFLLNT